MTSEALTVVAVVFEAEIPLLELQARSTARYLRADDVAEVLVLDNTRSGLPSHTRERLLRAYGLHRSVVSFVRPADVVAVPPAAGWYVQQVLKLAIAFRVTTRVYVALDAKDHFVRPVSAADFIGPNGLAKVPAYPYDSHPLRPDLERSLGYLGIDPEPFIKRFTATVTPFTFETQAVRELVDDLGHGDGLAGFAAEFIEHRLLEFFLYGAWLVQKRGSLEAAFCIQDRSSPKVWKSTASLDGVVAAIDLSNTQQSPLFSVHRRALARVGPAATGRLARFWTERKLFASQTGGWAFVLGFKVTYLVREVVRKASKFRAARITP